MQINFLHLETLYALLHSQAVLIREQQQEIQQFTLRLQMTPQAPNNHQGHPISAVVEKDA